LVGRVPESIASVSLVTLVRSTTGSYASAGIAAAGYALGSAMGAPVAGRGLDRVCARRLLIGMAGVFATALVAIALTAGTVPQALTVGLATAAGLARPPLDAAMRALWPRLVSRKAMHAAYSLDATLQELIWIAGPLLLSALLLLGGPALALLACAALGLAGTAVYATSSGASFPTRSERQRDRATLRSTRFSSLLAASALYGIAVGILTVTLIAFCSQRHARAEVGLLIAIWGVGSIVGGVAYGTVRWKAPPARRALLLLAALAALLALLATAPNLAVLALLMLLLGLPLSPWLGTLNEAVQALVPQGRTGEAFTWTFAVITAGIGIGNALGGPINQTLTTRGGFLAAAAVGAAGVALALATLALARRPGQARLRLRPRGVTGQAGTHSGRLTPTSSRWARRSNGSS
jgi:MFS family permease